MPPSVHMFFIHGGNVIESICLPIGMTSEENDALEWRNKDFRNIWEQNMREMSSEKTIQVLFHALLVSSDTLISSICKKPLHRQNSALLSFAVRALHGRHERF